MDIHVDNDEFADDTIQKVKEKATRRKGRGFTGGDNEHRTVTREDDMEYETLENNDDEEVGPKRSVEGWILFITNIQEESTEEDLSTLFSEYGAIKNIHMNIDRRTGYLKGYALVEYDAFTEAKNALNALNGKVVNGQAVSVSWAFVREPLKDKRSRRRRSRSRSRERR